MTRAVLEGFPHLPRFVLHKVHDVNHCTSVHLVSAYDMTTCLQCMTPRTIAGLQKEAQFSYERGFSFHSLDVVIIVVQPQQQFRSFRQ